MRRLFLSRNNERTTDAGRCQGGFLTAVMDDDSTGASDMTFKQQSETSLTRVQILDFSTQSHINFEAEIHYPEDVSRPFPSWNRSILTEIYRCHACSCHEILRTDTAGQEGIVQIEHVVRQAGSSG
jgi:hypothetical protein